MWRPTIDLLIHAQTLSWYSGLFAAFSFQVYVHSLHFKIWIKSTVFERQDHLDQAFTTNGRALSGSSTCLERAWLHCNNLGKTYLVLCLLKKSLKNGKAANGRNLIGSYLRYHTLMRYLHCAATLTVSGCFRLKVSWTVTAFSGMSIL
jgi:hypothetical protein